MRAKFPAVKLPPADESNLIVRAYRSLQNEFSDLGGVEVQLQKAIPLGAGLGGGSSNAAAFLTGMVRLYGLKISRKKLIKIGAGLGADVPFFILDVNQAVAQGIGEKLRPVPVKQPLNFLLIIDNKGLMTKKVYEILPRKRASGSLTKLEHTVKIIRNLLEEKDLQRLADHLHNDLEAPAFYLRPSLPAKLKRLRKLGITTARLSGSGPTVFAVLSDPKKAKQIAQKIRGRTVICHTY